MPKRRDLAGIFSNNEFRILHPERYPNIEDDHFPFYFKRAAFRETGDSITLAKRKSALLKSAGFIAHLENTAALSEQLNIVDESTSDLLKLPNEMLLQIIDLLPTQDLISFAQTSRYARVLSHDNSVWRERCLCDWKDARFFLVDLTPIRSKLKLWYNWKLKPNERLDSNEVARIFEDNLWRMVYISMYAFNQVPSIVYSSLFSRRSTECLPTSREIRYTSEAAGSFVLKGVTQVGRVEYVVFNNLQPWHRHDYEDMIPYSIFQLRDYGLKQTRSVRGRYHGNFFRRRGYYLKTLDNRKVHITYRYFPTVRFRLYRHNERVFLLCQDVHINNGQSTDCFTLYEILRDHNPQQDEASHNATASQISALNIENFQGAQPSANLPEDEINVEDISDPEFDF